MMEYLQRNTNASKGITWATRAKWQIFRSNLHACNVYIVHEFLITTENTESMQWNIVNNFNPKINSRVCILFLNLRLAQRRY